MAARNQNLKDRDAPLIPDDNELQNMYDTSYQGRNTDGLEGSWNTPFNGRNTDPVDDLDNSRDTPIQENDTDDGSGSPGKAELAASLSDGISGGMSKEESAIPKINTSNLTSPKKGLSKVLIRGVSRKRGAQIGGGVGLAGAITALLFLVSSSYLVHLKNQFFGPTNQYENAVVSGSQRRRVNSLFKIAKSASLENSSKKIVTRLQAEGFEVVADGAIIKSVKIGGVGLEGMDKLSAKQLSKEVKKLATSNDQLERAFILKIDDVSREFGLRFGGPVVRRNYFKRFLGVLTNFNWIRASKAVQAAGDDAGTRQLAMALGEAKGNEKRLLTQTLTPNEAARVFGDEGLPPGSSVDDIVGAATTEADDYVKKISDGVVSGSDEIAEKAAREVAEDTAKALAGSTDDELTKALPGIAKRLGSSIVKKIDDVVKGSFDVGTPLRQACRVSGTLQFIKFARNALLSVELAKLGVRFMQIADSQQAGLADSQSTSLMGRYFSGAAGSSGFQSLAGNVAINPESIARWSVGFANVGVLSVLANYVEKFPGNNSENCKKVNTLAYQAGGTVAGGLIAFATAGTSVAATLGQTIAMTVVNEVVFAVGKTVLLGAVSGAIINGFEEPGEDTGSLLGSALGSMSSGANAVNGGLLGGSDTFEPASEDSSVFRTIKMNNTSIFDRYANFSNTNSLIAQASLYLPQSATGYAGFIKNSVSLSSFGSIFSSPFKLITGKSQAQLDVHPSCNDVSVEKYRYITDGFCNPVPFYIPVLDNEATNDILKSNAQISSSGDPISGSEYEKFIENCFSGRPGLGHPPEFKDDGSSEPIDPTCIVGAGDPYDDPIAGDVPDEEGEKTPSKKERYAALYGYKVDEENFLADLNNDYGFANESTDLVANNKVFVLGDSLTVGMQNLAGTDQAKNYLQRTLNETGWSATVNAQGCRAVYQTQGPINGDGRSCPGETIVDGLSVINDPNNAEKIKSSGTVVISLGTNRYETDPNGDTSPDFFKQKAVELVEAIRQKSPNAQIYWVNLAFNSSTDSETSRNSKIAELVRSENISLLDWKTTVTSANSNSSTSDDIGYAVSANNTVDLVHHDADGYKKKADWLIQSLGSPPKPSTSAISNGGEAASIGEYRNVDIQVDRATECTGVEQAGAKQIQLDINTMWGGGTGSILACREVSTGGGSRSVHSEGRAIDSFFNVSTPEELREGNQAFGWLLANADNIGIQYLKFWRVQWSPSRGINCVKSRDDQSVHSNHLHAELNWSGSNKQTPYFTSGEKDDFAVNIDQGICPLL